jgi:hypothetical protein
VSIGALNFMLIAASRGTSDAPGDGYTVTTSGASAELSVPLSPSEHDATSKAIKTAEIIHVNVLAVIMALLSVGDAVP